MSQKWVPYNNGSAVQEAIAMANTLIDQGVKIIPMHQGAEETMPEGTLEKFLEYKDKISSKYNPAKGHAAVNKSFAEFAGTFLGLPNDHCFVLQTNGRVGLGHAFDIVANQYSTEKMNDLATLVPGSRWPMVDSKANQARFGQMVEYDVIRGKIADNIIAALKACPNIAALYTNFPHNPTGLSSSQKEIAEIQKALDEINLDRSSKGQPPVVHIADDPYFMGLEQNESAPYFNSPYTGQFHMNGPTPSIHIISLSKALGMANPGTHGILMTHDDMAAKYQSFLTTDLGPSFCPDLMDQVAALLSPDNHQGLRDHFAKIARKYEVNNKIFEGHLGSEVVDGDPGMTRVFRVPEDARNKRVKISGQDLDIRTTRDVAAYIANTTGTILVAQAENGEEKLIRAALKAEDPDVIKEGSKAIACALDDLKNAPPAP